MESHFYDQIRKIFIGMLEREFKLLLEEKHLYQSMRLSRDELAKKIPKKLNWMKAVGLYDTEADVDGYIDFLMDVRWLIYDPVARRAARIPFTEYEDPWGFLEFHVDHIKTCCGNCRELSPMNLRNGGSVLKYLEENASLEETGCDTYTLVFQCQNCRTGSEVFMVARNRGKLTLVGRSPMEHVSTPEFIPRDQQKYYSDAIIAFNSGQVLPALFMLRTLIEQYTRAEVSPEPGVKADEVLDRYMDLLPGDFKSRQPSLKQVYGDLSDAIHRADASEELFIESRKKIELHFKARPVYE